MKLGLNLFVLLVTLLAGLASSRVPAAGNEVVVGVLAHRGDEACISKWTPTIDYLNEEIPGNEFRLLPLDLNEMSAALAQGDLDFILTNPGNYVDLERKFGVSRITTLKNLHFGNPFTMFGAVIFSRADRGDIRVLEDLDGKSFGAVSADAVITSYSIHYTKLYDRRTAVATGPCTDQHRPV